MKLHFESDLPYQATAIEPVCDLFRGQEVCRSEFTAILRAPAATDFAADFTQQLVLRQSKNISIKKSGYVLWA